MAENSAGETNVSGSFDLRSSIIENSGVRDFDTNGISIYSADDEEAMTADTENRRSIRQQAKNHIDKIIEERIGNVNINTKRNMDEALEDISRERQQSREQHKANAQSKGKSAGKKIGPLDNRLDIYIDNVLENIKLGIGKIYGELYKRSRVITEPLSIIIDPLSTVEKRVSKKMAVAVDKSDEWVDELFIKGLNTCYCCGRMQKKYNLWCQAHKKHIRVTAAVLVFLAGSVSFAIDQITAYEYMYNGKLMGTVKDQKDVYKTVDIIGDKLSYAYGAEIVIDKDKDIDFRKVVGIGKQIDSKEDVLNQFTYLRDMNATAYAIKVDGKQKVVLYSKECADGMLEKIQEKYLDDCESVTYETIGFAENVQIEEINTKIGNIQKEESALDYMLTGAFEVKTYSVKSGDTFNQIAKDCRLAPEELQASNPKIDPAKLQIDQELVINRVCPVLTVETTEVAEYKEAIEYEITYEETSSLYKGEKTVKSAGVKGERKVVAQIVRHNGLEVNRNVLSSEVISEPKAQVVLQGTKDLPPLIGTGSFTYPTRGRLTSGFGTRWGRMHNGIDLAAPTGTKIRAADGGVVVSAGWEGALGYCVRIDHGGNKTTVYGHCSKLLVKKGDRVYKDQHIANIGSTGRSTGPHLHFEVHVNGVPKNPLKYLN